jgi:ribosomal protein L11 methylase PrmA
LETVVSNLPIKSLFHPALLVHLHLQAGISVRKASRQKLTDRTYFSKEKLLLLFEQLQYFFRKIEPHRPKNSAWYDYYDNTILSQDYLAEKERIVRGILKENSVHTILDVGANDGYFSFVALDYAKQVVALEYDHHCVNNLHKRIKKEKKNIFTLISGITTPSPALGFLNKEKYSLLDRLKGMDLTLALAVTHHLRIGFNVPFSLQAELFKSFSKKLIVEYVPKEDPKCQALLLNREDIFDDYSQERFVHSFVESGFVLKRESCLSSVNRILYVFEMEES